MKLTYQDDDDDWVTLRCVGAPLRRRARLNRPC